MPAPYEYKYMYSYGTRPSAPKTGVEEIYGAQVRYGTVFVRIPVPPCFRLPSGRGTSPGTRLVSVWLACLGDE